MWVGSYEWRFVRKDKTKGKQILRASSATSHIGKRFQQQETASKMADFFSCEIRNSSYWSRNSCVITIANFSHSHSRFFINTCAIIDIPESSALSKVDDKTTKQSFQVTVDTSVTINGNVVAGCTEGEVLQVTTLPHKTLGFTAYRGRDWFGALWIW